MRSMVLGIIVTLVLFTGLFVSQVEAKMPSALIPTGTVSFPKKPKAPIPTSTVSFPNQEKRSVPIPGTLLLLGGGFAGLVAWRARQRKPKA